MPRRGHIELAGGVYHVTNRGVNRREVTAIGLAPPPSGCAAGSSRSVESNRIGVRTQLVGRAFLPVIPFVDSPIRAIKASRAGMPELQNQSA